MRGNRCKLQQVHIRLLKLVGCLLQFRVTLGKHVGRYLSFRNVCESGNQSVHHLYGNNFEPFIR